MNCTCNNYELRQWSDVKMQPEMVDLYNICRAETPPNCTEPEIISAGHDRDLAEVFSDSYQNLYTTGQNVTLYCNFTGDPYPKITWTSTNDGFEKTDEDDDVTSDGRLFINNVTTLVLFIIFE